MKIRYPFEILKELRGFRHAIESVTDPRFGSDVLGVFGIRLDFLAEALDEGSKVVDLVSVVRAPYRLQQFAMRYRFIGVLSEVSKQIEFLRGQVGT